MKNYSYKYGQAGAPNPLFGSGPNKAVFSDNFNRADENLSASRYWTTILGSNTEAKVVSNAVNTTIVDQVIVSPDLGYADHFVQASFDSVSSGAGPFLLARTMDGTSGIGIRGVAGAIQIYRIVAGTFTLINTYTAAYVNTDIFRLEVIGNSYRLLKNGVEVVALSTIGATFVGTRTGIYNRTAAHAPFIDNYSAGGL